MAATKKELKNLFVVMLLLTILFIITSYFAKKYAGEIEHLIGTGLGGMLIYVALNIIEVIIAPINMLPAIAIASTLWGWITAALLTIIGWTIGAYLAFGIARKYGTRLIGKIIRLEKLHALEKKIPTTNLFWSIVLLRITLPADLLSYALGLFSKIHTRTYITATALGVTPLAVALAYMGSLALRYQIIGFIAAGIIFVAGIILYFNMKMFRERKKERRQHT